MAKKTVWDLELSIAGNATGASAALRQVQQGMKEIQAAGKQLGKDFKSFTSNATKLAVGVVGGVAAATAGVVAMANSFAETGDKIAKTSAAIGIGIEAYQELQYAMGQSGLSAEEFDGALQKFNLTVRQGAAGNAAAARQLEEVGLSAQKLAGLKPEQAMERLSDYMKALPSDAERTRVAVTLFGKSAGPKMMAAMKQGSAGLRDLMGEARSLGIVMSEEQAHQSEAYGSAMTRLQKSVTGMKNQFIGGAIGPLTEAFDHLKNAIVEQMPAISELGNKFGLWLGDMVRRLPEIIAKIKEFASNVWNNINAVKDFLGGWKNVAKILAGLAIAPTLISGLKVLFSLGNLINTTFAKALPKILAKIAPAFGGVAGAALPIIGIIAGIAAAIAGVVLIVKNWEKITTWIKEHKEVLTLVGIAVGTVTAAIIAYNAAQAISNAGGIVAVARMGAQAVATGVLSAATGVWSVAAGIGAAATTAFGAAMAFLTSPITVVILIIGAVIAAIYLLIKHWDWVKDVAGKVWDAICGFVGKAVDFIKNIFGGIGDFFSGIWGGIKNAAGTAWDGIKNVAGKTWDGIKGGASKAGEFLKNNWKTIAVGMVNPWAGGLKAMYDHNETFRNFVDSSWGKIKDFAGSVWNAMPDGVKDVFIKIKETISGAINNIKEFFAGLWGAVKEGPAATIEYLKNAFFGLFDSIKQKIETFVNFFKEKMEAVKNFFGGIGDKVGGLVGGAVDKFKSFLPGHAEGGIFTHRHIAEIAERGAEAVVPLNNSPQGFDIWKQAGELGGYISKMNQQTATASTSGAPPVMQAAAQRISGGENIIDVNFSQNNTFNGGTDKETVNQISAAGREAADDFEVRVKQALDNIMRNQRRVSFA